MTFLDRFYISSQMEQVLLLISRQVYLGSISTSCIWHAQWGFPSVSEQRFPCYSPYMPYAAGNPVNVEAHLSVRLVRPALEVFIPRIKILPVTFFQSATILCC
jgi:hypothetical protein